MIEIEKVNTVDDIRRYLESKGIQPSYQRIKILEYLIKKRNHPSVDLIYKDLVGEIPTLSKTTIYNTLNLFIEKGFVRAITIEGNEVRYDLITVPHVHFKCLKCGRIYDVYLHTDICGLEELEEIDGHKVIETHIYMKGICRECRREG